MTAQIAQILVPLTHCTDCERKLMTCKSTSASQMMTFQNSALTNTLKTVSTIMAAFPCVENVEVKIYRIFTQCFRGSDPFHVHSIHVESVEKIVNQWLVLRSIRLHFYFLSILLLYNTTLTALSLLIKIISNRKLNRFSLVSYWRIILHIKVCSVLTLLSMTLSIYNEIFSESALTEGYTACSIDYTWNSNMGIWWE